MVKKCQQIVNTNILGKYVNLSCHTVKVPFFWHHLSAYKFSKNKEFLDLPYSKEDQTLTVKAYCGT